MGWNTKATCTHIVQELNVQAQATYQSSKVGMKNLCTYPLGIEHASTSHRACAHILKELNMQS